MGNVIVVERNLSIQIQLRDMMEKVGLKVFLANGLNELMNIIQNNSNISLVILEYTESYLENIEFMDRAHQLNINIPVIIISSSNKKEIFLKSVEKGAVDFILKPLEEEYVMKKILKAIAVNSKNGLEQLEEVMVSFTSYISGEFIKAKKGDYPVTLMCLVLKNISDRRITSLEYYKYNQILFDTLQKHIWDTDIVVKYGAQSIIGVFPFCGGEGIPMLEKKIHDIYMYLKETNNSFEELCIEGFYAIYPEDGETKEKIFGELMKNI